MLRSTLSGFKMCQVNTFKTQKCLAQHFRLSKLCKSTQLSLQHAQVNTALYTKHPKSTLLDFIIPQVNTTRSCNGSKSTLLGLNCEWVYVCVCWPLIFICLFSLRCLFVFFVCWPQMGYKLCAVCLFSLRVDCSWVPNLFLFVSCN